MRFFTIRGLIVGAAAAASMGLAGCAALPSLHERAASYAFDDTASTRLGEMFSLEASRHPGLTGIEAVLDGRVAFGLRMRLARAAARSIDVQSFIWHADETGTLLFEEMLRAAERGVRVRLLIDDVNTEGMDPILALLAAQPNIELRLYNPFVNRGSRTMGILGDFGRLNRRMHNKSFTVDNQVSVVGGRNIADEYFEAGEQLSFADIDVAAVGEGVRAISAEFDRFWNSASAYPAGLIVDRGAALGRAEFAARAQAIGASEAAARYRDAIAQTAQGRGLLTGNPQLEWTTARVVYDEPEKTLNEEVLREAALELMPRLKAAFGSPETHLDLVSPYFVPGEPGTEAFAAMAQRGVRVRILTNSLAATDEVSVHSGYAKRRIALLRAGVQLFEIKPAATNLRARAEEIGKHSKSGLHAKTFAIDGRSIFVGSFNLDQRSIKLNTEMGLVIDSASLAARLSAIFDAATSGFAYRVTLGANGELEWHDADTTLREEPESSWTQRMKVQMFSILPIEWLL